MDSLARKHIMDRLMDLLGVNGGGIYERNRNWSRGQTGSRIAPMSPAFARQSTPQMTTAAQPTTADYNAKTARIMMDRQYGNNDAASPYYIGRWSPPNNPMGRRAYQQIKNKKREKLYRNFGGVTQMGRQQ